ncbi:VCBS repeat-containing protein [Candidatus Poribacteria bacterium]|nr:VCBS repeat-containing protein [Candidatus Poribacteria bacterium]
MPIFRLLLKTIPILMICFFIYGCSLKSKSKVSNTSIIPYSFERYKIQLGNEKHQTILTGFLTAQKNSELIVLYITEDNHRNIDIYTYQEGIWEKKYHVILRPRVMFVDIVSIGKKDLLLTYEPNQLNWFDIDAMIERPLMDISLDFKPDNEKVIYQIDITKDLNGDGYDDIVMPDYDGFWISTQLENGSFRKPIKIGAKEPFLEKTALGFNTTYRDVGINSLTIKWYLSRVHQIDYNRDNRTDLVFWNNDHYLVYYQQKDGDFSIDPYTFTSNVSFNADSAYSIAFDFTGENMFALIFGVKKNINRKVLYTFRDMNNDGISDMVIHALKGRGLGNQQSLFEIHYGKPIPNAIMFTKNVDITLEPKGPAGGLLPWGYSSQWIKDFDGDGDIDIVFKDVDTTLLGMTRALTRNVIYQSLDFFEFGNHTYTPKPTLRRKIKPKLDKGKSLGVYFPIALFDDLNGDNRADLIVGHNWSEMHVYVGISDSKLFPKEPQIIKISLPNDERNVRLVDLNRDNKKDILIYYPFGQKAHKMTLMTSK